VWSESDEWINHHVPGSDEMAEEFPHFMEPWCDRDGVEGRHHP